MIMETCCVCGVEFGIPDPLHEDLLRCKNDFFCPNGHKQHFVGEIAEHKIERLSRKLKEALAQRAEYSGLVNIYRAEIQQLKRSRAYYKGQLTRLKMK